MSHVELSRRQFLKASGLVLLGDRSILTHEQQKETWIPHWDGSWKRYNPNGGFKVVIFPGLGATSDDQESFRPIQDYALTPAGVDQHDRLDISYDIDPNSPLVGLPYDRENSTQNIDVSVYNIHKLIQLYERQFDKDKFIFIGHSQGGYLAYNLAIMHQPRVAAVITLNGALKGANILPGSVDQLLAPLIGGEAGKNLLDRGARADVSAKVEKDVAWLRKMGTMFFSFQSMHDPIVTPEFGHVKSSDTEIGGRKLETLFSTGKWEYSPVSQNVTQVLMNLHNSLSEDEFAQFIHQIYNIIESYDQHAAPLNHPEVLKQIKFIIQSIIGSEANPSSADALYKFLSIIFSLGRQ